MTEQDYHTRESWYYATGCAWANKAGKPTILLRAHRETANGTSPVERDDNVKRAIRCVNFCAGFTNEQLDALVSLEDVVQINQGNVDALVEVERALNEVPNQRIGRWFVPLPLLVALEWASRNGRGDRLTLHDYDRALRGVNHAMLAMQGRLPYWVYKRLVDYGKQTYQMEVWNTWLDQSPSFFDQWLGKST